MLNKLKNRNGSTFAIMTLVILASLGGGEYMRQQGKWGKLDGIKGSDYITTCDSIPVEKRSAECSGLMTRPTTP